MTDNADSPKLQSLVLSQEKGIPLSFWIGLAPNFKVTIPKDRIMVKVDALILRERIAPENINRGRAYRLEAPDFIVARLIEHWCKGRLNGMLQLSRDQLRQLLEPLKGEARVFWLKQPDQYITWVDGELTGVHSLLNAKPEEVVIPVVKVKLQAENRITDKPPSPTPTKTEPSQMSMTVDGSTQFLAITLPSRESVIYEEALALLKQSGFSLEPSNRKWWLRDRHKTLLFLAQYWDVLKNNYNAHFSEGFLQKTATLCKTSFQCDIKTEGKDFRMDLNFSAKGVDQRILHSALSQGKPYCETPDGTVVLIDRTSLEKLNTLQKKISGNPNATPSPYLNRKISRAEIPHISALLEEMDTPTVAAEEWKTRSRALKQTDKLEPAPMGDALAKVLRPYQKLGVAWMWHLYKSELGGILADEMGLGKTLQALALIECIRKSNTNPTLVVCPASLVQNWEREAHRFAPSLRTCLHHGTARGTPSGSFAGFDLVITSYTILTRDHERFEAESFAAIISDEAQHIKNRRTQNAQALRTLTSNGRFALTGTPIENSLDDLRSLFTFLMPGFLAKTPNNIAREEREWYDRRVHEQTAAYILRRTKKEVTPELPEKILQTVFCDMSPAQAKLYQSILEKGRQEISDMELGGASEGKVRMATLNQLLRLRQTCADPRILQDSLQAEDSSKLRAFREILEEAMDGGHRILVFSQFVTVLQFLSSDLQKDAIPFCYLDGSTKNRLAECDRFNNDPSIPVFLISLKAGGTGLNLTGADTVVHFDPWWNPAAEAQATDRAHRIGQTKIVTAIKLIVADTVEEKVLELQDKKSQLIAELFEASETTHNQLALNDLKALLE